MPYSKRAQPGSGNHYRLRACGNCQFHLLCPSLTGIRDVCAVIGGFHLTGGIFEKIIPATVAELKRINPRYIMPGHCTGWAAIHKIANEMPEAFIPNNVGTKLYITGF
ncbi:hypothetical protein SSCH_260004 [Syntrophaceticus schinkii]|uniref:Beta-lactamase domain protein n=1 Tax=Syntrophaceticus schinkii TaxID=499207 RepID=A0A0B7MDY8_9FIRM|nr:hypothetical protein SSCH_260004 [Syntrophaceticus schinkii]